MLQRIVWFCAQTLIGSDWVFYFNCMDPSSNFNKIKYIKQAFKDLINGYIQIAQNQLSKFGTSVWKSCYCITGLFIEFCYYDITMI